MIKTKDILFYIDKSDYKDIIMQLWKIIEETDPDFQAVIRDENIVITKNGNWEHWICSIGHDTDHINLFLHKGALLKNHKEVLLGSGQVMRRIELHNIKEIDRECICDLLRQAIEKQEDLPMFFANDRD